MLETIHSPLIEPVTESDLVAMLRATIALGVELVQARQLTGGLFNTSYYLMTRHPARAIILRIAPPASRHDTLFDYETRMMAAEPAIYDLVRSAGVPVPDVLAMDATGRVLPRPYILLGYLNTTPMNNPAVPDSAKPALRQQLGAYLRQMHAITSEQFGRVQPDGTVKGDASWRVVFGDLFTEAIRRCRQHHLLDDGTLTQAKRLFDTHAALFDDPAISPALIHGDIWEANVLLANDGTDRWHIAALIDIDRALFADRAFEPTIWDNTPEFYAGYDWPLDDSLQAHLRQQFYKLFHALFHVFVFGVQIPDATMHADFCAMADHILGELRSL